MIVSPVGLFHSLFAFTYFADEKARQEVREALRVENMEEDMLQMLYPRFCDRLLKKNAHVELTSGTAFWMGENITREESLVAQAKQWGISLFSGSAVTPEKRKEWAKEQAHGLLGSTADVPQNRATDLTNTVYFQGNWQSPFKKANTKDRTFYRTGGLPGVAPLMHQSQTDAVQLFHCPGFDAARIPYRRVLNTDLALHILLPHRNALDTLTGKDYLTPFVRQFTLSEWDSCQSQFKEAIVDLMIPKITLRQTHDLIPSLMQMGIHTAFQVPSLQTEVASPAIGRAEQKVYISIEEGTAFVEETKIVSWVGRDIIKEIEPQQEHLPMEKFYANRPFLFFLADEANGLVWFAGVIHDPAN